MEASREYKKKDIQELKGRWDGERIKKIVLALRNGENWTVHLAGLSRVDEVLPLDDWYQQVDMGLNWHEDLGRDLRGANLWRGNLQKADLQGANLQAATLLGANLQEADLSSANLQEADLWGANLQEANLSEANLQQAHLAHANLQGGRLAHANLHEANLFEANLQEADLGGANLQEADLRDVNLQRADLSGCDLSVAGTLRFAHFEGGIVDESTVLFRDRGASLLHRKDRLPGEASARERLLSIPGEARRVFLRFLRYRKTGTAHERSMMCESMRRIMERILTALRPSHIIERILTALRPPPMQIAIEMGWERVHRELKQAFKDRGLYAEAARHDYRQMVYRRRRKWGERKPYWWLCPAEWLLLDALSGYGEKPQRTIFWIIATVLMFTGIYAASPGLVAPGNAEAPMGFWNALYYSVVTFTTLGFGPGPEGAMRIAVAIEAALGALLIAIAMITYTRLAVRD